MRKLDKRAISILVIAIFLISMIPIMPAQAAMGTIYVSGYPKILTYPLSTDVTLQSTAGGTATYSGTYAYTGIQSIHLTADGTPSGDEARIKIDVPSGTTLADIDSISWMIYAIAEYPAHIDITVVDNIDGVANVDSLTAEVASNSNPLDLPWSTLQTSYDYLAWIKTFETSSGTGDSVVDGDTIFWVTRHGAGNADAPYGTLDELVAGTVTYPDVTDPTITISGATVVDFIEIEVDDWLGAADVYIDDISVNGVLYHSEEKGVDKSDILIVSGSLVTSGAAVNLYWDYVTTAGLMNNTVANPDGTFEVDLKIPSCLPGEHYIWVRDVDTGETEMYDTPIYVVPKISLSPSSGLVGDEITVSGYAFADENDVTVTWEGATAPLTTSVETDEDGYFTYKFDVPTGSDYGSYDVTAVDEYGWTADYEFTVGASIIVNPDEGPTGTKVEVEGRGWSPGEFMSFTLGATTVDVVEDKVITVKSDGTFKADVIIPDMSSKADYELEATETNNIVNVPPAVKAPAHDHFEVTGLPKIKVSPTYGTPGAIITVTGSNFTQIAGTIVTVTLDSIPESVLIDDAETNSDGTFETTFISPAVTFTTYDVTATDEYSIDAKKAFKVGLIALILNPVSGEAGQMVSLTGIGFANGDYNVTFASSDESYTKLYEDYGTVSGDAIADPFYVPNVDPGTYYLTISDTDDNELTSTYTVTESTYVIVKPSIAPNKYNVSLKGYHFADAVADVEFIIYNVTSDGELDEDWDMTVQTTTGAGPTVDDTATNSDGNFTGWWKVDTDLSNGDYIINVTGGKGLLVQIDFSVVAARVQVTPRKALFDRGDTVSFDISNDFPIQGTIEIYDPNEILYWITDPFYDGVGETADVWVLVEGLETVPYYSQTANANPMEIANDAPLGTWRYFFYDADDDELMNSTFVVGVSTAAQIDEMLDDVRDDISSLASDLAGITDDVEDDIAALSGEIAGVASDLTNLADDIVSDLADDIADATDAGQSALDAVEDLAESMTDLGEAVSDIADIASDSAEASQSAADAANDAVQAAEDAQGAAQGLTGLVYGAIGASLIAALAAIISLMQISKRIAG